VRSVHGAVAEFMPLGRKPASVDDGLGGRRSRWTNGNGARVSFAAMDYERTGFSYSGPRDCERQRGRILPGQVLGSRPVFADSIEGCVGE